MDKNVKKKKILILGGSGGVGQWLTQLANEQQYQVTVLLRSTSQYQPPQGVHIIRGNVLDSQVIDNAVQGQDAIISTIGIMRSQANNPWSKLISPVDLNSSLSNSLVTAMKKHNIERIIAISAAGVAESEASMSLAMKLLVKLSNIRKTFSDFANMETTFSQSGLDTLCVRPVGLVDNQAQRLSSIVDKFQLSSQISKKDVALWMLNAVERPAKFSHPTEMIGWR
ncbi:NAD-dependent epimerase/dehydratase family protein [Vibrio sinensis]|uniref:NAD-dependent epimerase/dehydratase family protein n=1 Tax=Vibrio sinensis TaxID=2302434 RepID=A0A3A6QXU9_9VIBR|nr:NAD(P)H-binding protein [Vibrio sinensis]RJX73637.1 NAD-dependent epimerase/dehydratase family protein [Vibrio sinensis]